MRALPACLAGLMLLLAAAPADAHVRLLGSDPADRAVLGRAPDRLDLRFNEVPRLAGTGVELISPDGAGQVLAPLPRDRADLRRLSLALPSPLAPGLYRVHWKALSPNAHRTEGRFSFTVRGR